MNREGASMRQLRNIVLAATLLLGGCQAAMADDLTISGLGTLPLGDKISVTDGKDNVLGELFKKETKRKGYGKTAKAAMWSMLAVPPGMNLYPEKEPYPYDSLHLYQLMKRTVSGTYTAAVLVFSGTEEDFFHGGNRKAALFWKNAFREDAGRPTSLFGMPKISTAEFQGFLDEILKEKSGDSRAVKILTFNPWHAFKDGDGTYHWSQEAKVIITNEKGLSYPLWIYTSLYKEGNRYYLIEFNGSHEAADALGDSLVYGLYQLKRSSK